MIAQLGTIFRNFVSENWKSASAEDLPQFDFFEAGNALAGLRDQTVRPLTILMCAVGLVLLIGCANVATLLLARAGSREREISIRASLGASRGRLIRQLMTESLVLAVLGGIAGLLIAYWASQGLTAVIFPHPARVAIDVTIDKAALFFTLAISLLTGVIFGIIPACRLTYIDLTAATKQRSASGDRRSQRIGKTLVTGQLAVSLVLMICAGLFVRTLCYMEKRDLGFDGRHLLLFELDPTRAGYEGDRLSALYERIRRRIAALPGVKNVTLNEHLPFTWANHSNFRIEGSSLPVSDSNASWSRVGANFCATMNASLVLGRDLRESDGPSSNRVAVINETFAQRFFGGENPLGHRFIGVDGKTSFEIVGVVRDLVLTDLHDPPTPEAYIPYLQTSNQLLNGMSYEVLTEGDPMAYAHEVAKAVTAEAPQLPLINLVRQSEQTSDAMFIELMFSRLATFFGVMTLALSCIGLYGTIAYQVARRVPEIGIRLSLGATPHAVLRMILSQSLVLVTVGIGLGLTLSFAATGMLRTMIFGVGVNDTATFGYSAALMLIVTILACWIPARRASRLDPNRSLRAG